MTKKRGKPLQRRTRIKARNEKRAGHRFPKTVDEDFRAWFRPTPELLAWAAGRAAA